jgi:Orthoreovirus membrane fusion protein p10
MPVLSLATSPIVTYDTLTKCFAILAIYIIFIFFCCCILGYHRRSSQSSTYSRETARLVSGYHRNTAPIIRVVVVAPESRPTSARTQSFPQPPPIYGRGAQPAVKTPVATDHERNLYRSGSVPPPGAGESRQTLSSPARTQASYQLPSTHSRTQTTVGALASAGHGSIHYGSTLTTPSHAGGSRQIAFIVPYSQSSSRHAPKPVAYPAHISKLSQPSLTHALNQPSAYPQVPTSIGGSKPTHVALPSPVPAVPVSDEIENVENVNTAEELRERARGHDRQMHHERKLAKSAHKRGDINAERGHKEKATAHQTAKKALNEKAADIIFNENNKVCI